MSVLNVPKSVSGGNRGRPKGALNKSTLEKLGLQENKLPDEPEVAETEDQIAKRIDRTFSVMEKVLNGVVKQNIRALIISGAAGSGKSYEVDRALVYAAANGKIRYTLKQGSMSAIHLYKALFENCEPDQVLVIDDCDAVFFDMEALNHLKAALDTKPRRVLSWNKESNILEKYGVPTEFEFQGSVIFISNIDFKREIERNTRLTPHLRALINRTMYVDLGIHSRREILVRIKSVLDLEAFSGDNRFNTVQMRLIKGWISENFTKVRELSIRTAVHLGKLIKDNPQDWEDMAEVTLLHR